MAAKLIESNVKTTLFHMAFPMLAGTIAINTYNLVDTWFVSKLGTIPLAAMGFTFPVVTLFTFIVAGIGTGITTLMSHAIGRADMKAASRIVFHGVILMVLVSKVMSISGYLSIDSLFKFLGTDSQTLPLVRDYMRTWYMGAIFMAIPMMGNGIIISLGDSKAASRFMVFGAVLNCILDPVMIFGFWGIPAMGIHGAALATVISQAASTIWLFLLLTLKFHLLSFGDHQIGLFFHSCKRIIGFAIPSSISMILHPLSSAIIITLISKYGNEAVAASSAAGRVEMFAFVIPMALGMSLVPFVSQNFGADRFDRIEQAKSYAARFALLYGAFIALVFFCTAPYLARIFTGDPKVVKIFTMYIRTISFGYGLMEVHRYSGFLLTGIHRPVLSTLINAFRVLVLLVPLSYLGSYLNGIRGIFIARLITDLLAGTVASIIVSWLLKIRKPAVSATTSASVYEKA